MKQLLAIPETAPVIPNAPCAGDPETFFAEDAETQRYAKRLCGLCPGIGECGDWAITHNEHGIWGGMTERERRTLRRTLRLTAA